VLVRVLAFEGKHKIANRWEEDVYIVATQPNPDLPVYTVYKEVDPTQRQRTLHRNHLLPIGSIQDETAMRPAQAGGKQRPPNRDSDNAISQTAGPSTRPVENPAQLEEEEESDEELSVQLYLPTDAQAATPPAADPRLAPKDSATPLDVVGDGHIATDGEGDTGQHGDDRRPATEGQPDQPIAHADEVEASGQEGAVQADAPEQEGEEVERLPDTDPEPEAMPRRSSRIRHEPDRFQAGVNCVTQTEIVGVTQTDTVDLRARMLVLSELLSTGCILDPQIIANLLKQLATK
jgi:hypothetical protein